MVGGGHNLVLSLGLGNGIARTRGLKRGCPKKDGKINSKITCIYSICENIDITTFRSIEHN